MLWPTGSAHSSGSTTEPAAAAADSNCPIYAFEYTGVESGKIRSVPEMRKKFFKWMSRAMQEAEKGNLDEAKDILDSNFDESKMNSYEIANVYNLYAFLFYMQKDYAKTQENYEKVLAQKAIPLQMEHNTVYTLGQLAVVTEDYCTGLSWWNRWISEEPEPSTKHFSIIAEMYRLNGQPDASIDLLSERIEYEASKEPPANVSVGKYQIQIGKVYGSTDRPDEATAYFNRAIETLTKEKQANEEQAENPDLFFSLATAYHENGESENALGAIEETFELIEKNGMQAPAQWQAFRAELIAD